MEPVIYVTRLDGSQLVVNADLIETVEHTADTVITLIDGKRLVVQTPVDEVVQLVVAFHQNVARGPLRIVRHEPDESGDPTVAEANGVPRPIHARVRADRES